jgi:putative ABC transport system permease protein
MASGHAVRADDEITLDTWLAEKTDVQIGDTVDVLGRRFTVVGLTRGTASWMGTYLFVSRAAAEDLLEMPGMASFFLLRLPEGADKQAVSETIQSQIPGVGVVSPQKQAEADKKVLKTALSTPINVMLFISVITGIAVMGLTIYTAILDRVREYGVLKAVGANSRWLQRLVMAETLYRAGLGFVLGIGLSYLTADLIMRVFPQFTILIRPQTILWIGPAALVMSIFAALLPLRRVTAIDPAIVFKA